MGRGQGEWETKFVAKPLWLGKTKKIIEIYQLSMWYTTSTPIPNGRDWVRVE